MSFLMKKTFFFVKSNLEMIGKDAKFDYLYVKLKLAFKTSSQFLSKLVENVKIHLGCNFEGFMLEGRVAIVLFENCCATNLAHISDVPCLVLVGALVTSPGTHIYIK